MLLLAYADYSASPRIHHQHSAVCIFFSSLRTVSLSGWPAHSAWVPPNLSWGDSRPYDVLQRTLDKDCGQAEEPKQLVDEASRFHLGRQHSAVICSGALLFSSRVLRPSLVTLCSHESGRCAVELYHAPHLWYPSFYTSPMASSALQHWTTSPTKEGYHWQAGGENCQTWQLANPAWYP